MSKLTRMSWSERRKAAKMLGPARALARSMMGPSVSEFATAELGVRQLMLDQDKYEHEWVYWYVRGDTCQETGWYDDALRACCRCYHMRKDDPRSAYALATSFYQLSRARLADIPGAAEAPRQLSPEGLPLPSPKTAKAALSRLGFSIVETAAAAIHFFTLTLHLVEGSDRRMVENSIAKLRAEFPNMKPELAAKYLAAPLAYVEQQRP